MATTTATRAADTFPIFKPPSGVVAVARSELAIAANPTAGDIWQMVRVPAGARVVGGWIRSGDMDTNATETLDIDIGWEANGDEVADTDGFGNLGVMGTDTVAGIKPEEGYNFPLGGVLITAGSKKFNAETIISITVVAAAATFAAGTVSVVVYYTVD
jgi:hypothetical protein